MSDWLTVPFCWVMFALAFTWCKRAIDWSYLYPRPDDTETNLHRSRDGVGIDATGCSSRSKLPSNPRTLVRRGAAGSDATSQDPQEGRVGDLQDVASPWR